MQKQDKYAYWMMLSTYDLDSIPCLIAGERWVYVAYLCQQAIERQLKGMYVYYTNTESPKTHNVNFLFSKILSCEKFASHLSEDAFRSRREEIEDFLVDVMFYYMSDYPFSYKNICNRFVKKDVALELYEKTQDVIAFLRTLQPEVTLPAIDENEPS